MSQFISLDDISLAYGLHPLLDHASLQINKGERVCLIGSNGAGKSSLLKIIDGSIKPDSGSVWRKPHLRLARLSQELPLNITSTVYEFVAEGLAETGKLLADYHALTLRLSQSHTNEDLAQLEKLQHIIDTQNGWQFEQNIKTILTRLALNADQRINELSGGWQRRAALAKILVSSPELLLLDEPTNHLDIDAIQWLEDYLISCDIALLFVTHDRLLLQRLATRIIELDRGHLTSWPGSYDNFLRRKAEMLHAETKQNEDFDKKLAQEERWIRQGIKARRTRNEGRVRALEDMRRTRMKRRDIQDKASFSLNEANLSGQLVVEATNLSYHINQIPIIKHFSIRIMRGDRIGLIGPNGIGKSTLLNILLGSIPPQEGAIKQGTKLQIAYFDQLRKALDPEKTVIDNVAEGREFIEINNEKKHIISYLSHFLFTPARALTPVKALSGGECNRLLLARLFSQPANMIVMDEPTNDLDIETLELLEELLTDFQGTLLVVSHDRKFLDNVITSTLVFEGEGKIAEYVGGYQDWIAQRKIILNQKQSSPKPAQKQNESLKKSKKLSYKEQKELDELPHKIELMESQYAELQKNIANAEFYKQNQNSISETMMQFKKLESDIHVAYQRWNELEEMKK